MRFAACRRAIIACLGVVLLSVCTCCNTEAQASATIRVVLGAVPPHAEIVAKRELRPLDQTARLLRIDSTCGCLEAKLYSKGKAVPLGGSVGRSVGIELHSTVKTRSKARHAEERVSAVFVQVDGQQVLCSAVIEMSVTPELATVQASVIRFPVALPMTTATKLVALRRPVDWRYVRVTPSLPLRVLPGDVVEGDSCSSLILQCTGLTRTEIRKGALLVPIGDGAVERIPVELRALARQGLRPKLLTARLVAGSTYVAPVRLVGQGWERDAIDIAWEAATSVGTAKGATDRPHLSLVPGDQSDQLEFKVNAGMTGGLFKGKILIKPSAAATFRLALPYAVRVLAAPSEER